MRALAVGDSDGPPVAASVQAVDNCIDPSWEGECSSTAGRHGPATVLSVAMTAAREDRVAKMSRLETRLAELPILGRKETDDRA